ncbi:MAG: hypothetical protein H7039_00245 [Bryobacteraceae bacterium]|nr:hypothetical protein [Bryobacteraceae bacterium]
MHAFEDDWGGDYIDIPEGSEWIEGHMTAQDQAMRNWGNWMQEKALDAIAADAQDAPYQVASSGGAPSPEGSKLGKFVSNLSSQIGNHSSSLSRIGRLVGVGVGLISGARIYEKVALWNTDFRTNMQMKDFLRCYVAAHGPETNYDKMNRIVKNAMQDANISTGKIAAEAYTQIYTHHWSL